MLHRTFFCVNLKASITLVPSVFIKGTKVMLASWLGYRKLSLLHCTEEDVFKCITLYRKILFTVTLLIKK